MTRLGYKVGIAIKNKRKKSRFKAAFKNRQTVRRSHFSRKRIPDSCCRDVEAKLADLGPCVYGTTKRGADDNLNDPLLW